MTTVTFAEIEAENSRLRAEIVEARELLRDALEKLGWLAAVCGFEPDKSLPVIVDQVQMKMEAVPALREATIRAAAKWIEGYSRVPLEERTTDSWTKYAHEASELVSAIRKRE